MANLDQSPPGLPNVKTVAGAGVGVVSLGAMFFWLQTEVAQLTNDVRDVAEVSNATRQDVKDLSRDIRIELMDVRRRLDETDRAVYRPQQPNNR